MLFPQAASPHLQRAWIPLIPKELCFQTCYAFPEDEQVSQDYSGAETKPRVIWSSPTVQSTLQLCSIPSRAGASADQGGSSAAPAARTPQDHPQEVPPGQGWQSPQPGQLPEHCSSARVSPGSTEPKAQPHLPTPSEPIPDS